MKAPVFGERGASFGDSIILKNPPTAIISTGDYRAKSAILGALAAAHIRWPEDTVFARISLLAGWPSVPEAHETHGLPFLQTRSSHVLTFLQTRSSHVLTFLQDGEKGPCALPRVWGRSL
ncbi:hypothetical protein DOT_2183 [Desulfosporosinus sp. OT]|nr:hypothetical protein DOT_2183 [Desulfosporosinus sp. OT]